MKKIFVAAFALLATFTTAASAAPIDPTDAVSTSNFTVTVEEPSLGITISGTTNAGKMLSRQGANEISFDNLTIKNSGNMNAHLYAQMMSPTGIEIGTNSGELNDFVQVGTPDFKDITDITTTENELRDMIGDQTFYANANSNAEIYPGESTKSFMLTFSTKDYFPSGNISMPIKWTMKAE
jgi:hypothetical protein